MTYAQFLLIFIILPIIPLYSFFKKNNKDPIYFKIMLFLSFMALSYTTPWDNYLVKTNVWNYIPERVLGKIGYVPIEEYCFFILQTIFAILFSFFCIKKTPIRYSKKEGKIFNIILILLITFFIGSFLLFEKSRYMALILTWSLPIIILQYVFGGRYLLNNLNLFFTCLVPLTLYLSLADMIAISQNIWKINPEQVFGIYFGPLPLEEMTFFLVTNIMVIQGLLITICLKDTFYTFFKKRVNI